MNKTTFTDCCQARSDWCDAREVRDADGPDVSLLCCKGCGREVPLGQGDGSKRGYTVGLVHDGGDWAVLDATPEDSPDCIFDDHAEACDRASKSAAEMSTNWYDFSTGESQC